MSFAPSATDITVREVLAKLDGEFATTAKAVENGEFALWVGSGFLGKPLSRDPSSCGSRIHQGDGDSSPTPPTRIFLLSMKLSVSPDERGQTSSSIYIARSPTGALATRDHQCIVNSYSRVLDIPIPTKRRTSSFGRPSIFAPSSLIPPRREPLTYASRCWF